MLRRFSTAFLVATVALIILGGTALRPSDAIADLVFDWADVGNVNNMGDVQPQGTFGAVGYDYRIGKTEVTNAQYATFLNAVAGTDITGLYNAHMGNTGRGGITQSCTTTCSYSVKENMGDKPVNFVSFIDAMRFTNWLHNGQPSGMQTASTTEDGVYTIGNGVSETRNPNATYFIPSENEWYKAAYHKNDGVTRNYWDYPTSSEMVPTVATANSTGDISNPGTNVANYLRGADWNGQNGNVTTVGTAGAGSTSFYGTFDQGGNVWEWNEAVISSSFRGFRGGSWSTASDSLAASFRLSNIPSFGFIDVGFRVASVSEPSPMFACDINRDSNCDSADINLLYDAIATGEVSGRADIDGNGVVNNADIDDWLSLAGTQNSKSYLQGDSDLDGNVSGGDFTSLAANFGNSGSSPSAASAYWGNGNYDGMGFGGLFDVDGGDFTVLAANFGASSLTAVPEPNSAWVLLGLSLLWMRK